MGYLDIDDHGKAKYRARQNVILELGYFIGKISRKNVFPVVKNPPTGNLEIPSDYSGVIYELYDQAGGWKIKLAKSLKARGYDVDLKWVCKALCVALEKLT